MASISRTCVVTVLRQQARTGATSSRGSIGVRSLSGIGKVAEDKMNAWIREGGAKNLKKGGRYQGDRHKDLANTLGLGNDYVHSKILADNNFKPVSIQRRLDMDKAWDVLKEEIREAFETSRHSTILDFLHDDETKSSFEKKIQELDVMAKKCNDAIIDDSLRFNGRSPVRHARRFKFEERIRDAIEESE